MKDDKLIFLALVTAMALFLFFKIGYTNIFGILRQIHFF